MDSYCNFIGHSYIAHHFPRWDFILYSRDFNINDFFMKTFSWIPQALSYLRQLVLWCWLRFRMGCLMFECESFIIYHWPTHLNFYLDLGRRFIHSWSWSTKQKTFHCRKAHSYLRVSAAFISSINTETSSIDCNKPFIARSCIIQINVPSAFELIFSAFSIRPDAQAFVL